MYSIGFTYLLLAIKKSQIKIKLKGNGEIMKTNFLFLAISIILAGQAQAQDRKIYSCNSGGVGMRLVYFKTPISKGKFRMEIKIANPFSNEITGVFMLSKLNDYGLSHFRGVGRLSNGTRLNAEILVDYGVPHQLVLSGFSSPTPYSVTFGCN